MYVKIAKAIANNCISNKIEMAFNNIYILNILMICKASITSFYITVYLP